MYFKKTFLLVVASLLMTGLFSCKKEANPTDPALYGTWTDGNVNYTFATNNTFGIKYRRIGNTQDKVETDSIWGNFTIDKNRSNINWDAKYLTKKSNPNMTVTQNTNLPVWNYSYTSDSTMTYSSNSITGNLKKAKK